MIRLPMPSIKPRPSELKDTVLFWLATYCQPKTVQRMTGKETTHFCVSM